MLLSASVMLLVFDPAAAQEEPVPVDTYWEQITQTRTNLLDLAAADPQTQQAGLEAEAKKWESITAVELEDGTIIPVNHSYLVSQLRAESPNLDRLGRLLDRLLDQHRGGAAVIPPWADIDEFGQLDRILASPEFDWGQDAQPNPIQEWLDRVGQRLTEFLNRLLPNSVRVSPDGVAISGRLLNSILTTLGMIVMVVILFFAFRSLLSDLVTEAELESDEQDAVEILTSETALKRAQNLSRGGDYRTAVRYLYLSSLLLLEERGLLQYDRSRTNREYLSMVKQQPRLKVILHDVVDVFDRVWYGYQDVGEESYSQYEERVTELRQQK